MAERTTTLTLSPDEERALSFLIAALCNEPGQSSLESVFGRRAARDIEMIGRVNAALNASR